jgi:hypothetical protein
MLLSWRMLFNPAFSAEPGNLPMNIDHIVYAVSDLESGMTEIEKLLGVRPVIGGRHPDFGTHNALLSLGPGTYLEIIAPDPSLPAPDHGLAFGISEDQPPGIVTWALRVDEIRAVAEGATAAGVPIGAVESGSREKPDGTVLSWQLSNPNAMPFDGAIPFLINWGDTPHPAATTPRGGDLLGIRIEHPEADEVRKALSALGMDIEVNKAATYSLIATIKTDHGIVEIQ